MKFNNVLRGIAAAAALTVATPTASAEPISRQQRACVERVLKSPMADTDAVRQCLATAKAGGESDSHKKHLSPDSPEAKSLFATLEGRFRQESPVRPAVVKFIDVKRSLEARQDLLSSLNEMEKTGGKPDVIAVEGNTFVFADVSAESPKGRRNLDYDQAKAMAEKAGYEMMPPEVYQKLQNKVRLDANTWSWLLTDAETRATGEALGGGRGGDVVYVGPGWADYRSPSEGFRGLLRVPKS